MIFYNLLDQSYEAGPFEADSKEELADQMTINFRIWAIEQWIADDTTDTPKFEYIARAMDSFRNEFIAGLEEV